jgi:hypothetical protein
MNEPSGGAAPAAEGGANAVGPIFFNQSALGMVAGV